MINIDGFYKSEEQADKLKFLSHIKNELLNKKACYVYEYNGGVDKTITLSLGFHRVKLSITTETEKDEMEISTLERGFEPFSRYDIG